MTHFESNSMFELENYNFSEKIFENEKFRIQRGVRESDNKSVLVKYLTTEYPTPEELDLLEYEYRFTKDFNLPGVVNVYSLENVGHSKAIVLEDFNAVPLRMYLTTNKSDLDELLQISKNLIKSIGSFHKINIVHKNINPDNVFINPETKQIKFTDFSNAFKVQKEEQTRAIKSIDLNSLPYISPEQTGRMNRTIDYRTDFYSLGAILYELFTGRPPFVSKDPLELVHSHIARVPMQPDELKKDVPKVISEIIMKLLSKPAEDRYQSAGGLLTDLEECRRRLQNTGMIKVFPISEQDNLGRFQIPEKLYGRELEIKLLLEEFEQVVKGEKRLIFFCGPPGIGKTVLIHEVRRPIVEHGGTFISGKFDQYKRNIPYSAIIQAFEGMIQQLLMGSQKRLDEWASHISKALGPNAQIIIEVLPELELVIGKQSPIQHLDPIESRNRFIRAFQNFIRVFPWPENPLVLFIDDWQWTDFGSLTLLKTLLEDTDLKHLLFIGTYRDNEVDASHPFIIALKEIEKEQQIEIKHITLEPLKLDHINQLVIDTLYRFEQEITTLSLLIEEKTRGNPFFVKQILHSFFQEKFLRFDNKSQNWKWNIAAIKESGVTDNVVELMVKNLKNLPKNTQKVLQLASCMGNQFNLRTLSIIYKKNQPETLEQLWKAIEEGYILPQDMNYKLISTLKEKKMNVECSFKFLHNRVHQASYSLIPVRDKKAIHLKIGRLLLKNTKKANLEETIFDIVNQLNQGIELITEEQERLRLAQLNLSAGRKAKTSVAFNSALKYFTNGTEILKETNWRSNYELMLELHKERAKTEYLNGNFEKSEKFLYSLLEKVKTDLEKAEIYGLLASQKSTISAFKEALQLGVKGLSLLGMELPGIDLKTAYLVELEEVKKNLGKNNISSLVDEPEMTNLEKRAAAKLVFLLVELFFLTDYKKYQIYILKIVNLTLKFGLLPESAPAYSNYGLLLCSNFQEYRTGYEFGLLGLKICERFNDIYYKCNVYYLIGAFLTNWVRHVKYSLSFLEEGYQAAMESGNFNYASYSLSTKIMTMFYQGSTLEHIQETISQSLPFTQKTKIQLAIDCQLAYKLTILNLQGKTLEKLTFHDEKMSEAEYLDRCQNHQSFMAIFRFQTLKSMVLYLYGEYFEALKSNTASIEFLKFNRAYIIAAARNFYYSLTLTALYPQALAEKKVYYMKQLEINQKQMKVWADTCPENFENMYLLVEAEMSRISDKDNDAIELYTKAIESAHKNEFIQNEAIANELCAKFFLRKKDEQVASLYMKRAYGCYRLWGAKRKIEDLENKYPQLKDK